MHRDLAGKAFICAIDGNQNADLAHAGCGRVVDIRYHGLPIELGHTAQGHVLADLGDGIGDDGFHGCAVDLGCIERVQIGCTECGLGDGGGHALKLCILGHEIRFGIHFDRNTGACGNSHGHKALGCGAARFLCSFGQTLGAQPVNGGFEITIGFGQCLLGIHHACACRFAQFLYHCSGNRHERSPEIRSAREACPARVSFG